MNNLTSFKTNRTGIMRIFLVCLISGMLFLPLRSQTINTPWSKDTIFLFEPISRYFLININKEVGFDSTMCKRNLKCLTDGYNAYFKGRSNIQTLNYDLAQDSCAFEDLMNLFTYVSSRSIEVMPPLFCLDSILNQIKSEYILLSYSSGFTRTKENYKSAMVKGAFLSALTLGSIITVPYESVIDLKVVMFNKRTRKVIISNSSKMMDCSPDDQKDIDTQIERVFKHALDLVN